MVPKVYLVKVDTPISESVFRYLLGYIHEDKQERILKQRIRQNAENMLIGDILAKVAIKKVFGVGIANQHFGYDEHSKPCLLNFPGIHFILFFNKNIHQSTSAL